MQKNYPDWETVEGVMWRKVVVFTDEYSDQSSKEIEQEHANAISLKSIFEIVKSWSGENCLFHTLNNLVFGVNRNIKDLREDICNYVILEEAFNKFVRWYYRKPCQ